MKTLEQVEADGGYNIILADANWGYRNGGRGAAKNHYKTATPAQLAALPVARLAAKDSVLFQWGTWPNLPIVLATMEAWGFDFKTLGFLWVKHYEKSGKPFWGGGFWSRSNSEFCLLGVRGNLRRVSASVHQLVETWDEQDDLVLRASVNEHSAKPSEVRDRIVKLMGDDLTAIELFARDRAPGWDAWGDDPKLDGSDVEMFLDNLPRATVSDVTVSRENESETELLNEQGDEDMAGLPKALADKVGAAKSAGGGNYIEHGIYTFMIDKWFYQKIQDECIIVEFFVAEAAKNVVREGDKIVENPPNAIGSTCSDTANFDGAGKLSAPANSRAPVLGLFGFKEGEIPDAKVSETLSYVCSDAQPARGMLIACSTFSKEIRSKPGSFITGRNYSCINKPGEGLNTADLVKARLDALARSADECVKVTQAQIAQARGTAITSAIDNAVAAPSIPAPPAPAPAAPTAPNPLDGWTRHPSNAAFMYKGDQVKLEADLLAGR